MKFNQIADGQQFEYQGTVYTKKGPLMAVDAQGQSKLLPRSAAVSPLTPQADELPPPAAATPITLGQAHEAFETFYARCLASIETYAADLDSHALTDLKQALDTARQAYLKSLG